MIIIIIIIIIIIVKEEVFLNKGTKQFLGMVIDEHLTFKNEKLKLNQANGLLANLRH